MTLSLDFARGGTRVLATRGIGIPGAHYFSPYLSPSHLSSFTPCEKDAFEGRCLWRLLGTAFAHLTDPGGARPVNVVLCISALFSTLFALASRLLAGSGLGPTCETVRSGPDTTRSEAGTTLFVIWKCPFCEPANFPAAFLWSHGAFISTIAFN